MDNTTTTPTYTVAQSSTGMIHRAYSRGEGRRVTRTAECATDFMIGARAVYLTLARQIEQGTRPEGRLCQKCFPTR